MKITMFLILAAFGLVIAIPDNTKPATKSECVAYWTNRVSTWNNPPTQIQIEEYNNYCGGIHE